MGNIPGVITFYDDLKVYKRISNLQNNIDDTLLPKCIEGADVWTDCFARYEWPEGNSSAGDIYTGEWKDNQMNGLGKLFVGNHGEFAGDVYTGSFKNGRFEGLGIYSHANGDEYIGNQKNGDSHGKGNYKYKNGAEYIVGASNAASDVVGALGAALVGGTASVLGGVSLQMGRRRRLFSICLIR